MKYSSRLELACALYEDCDLAADIGTDHAHLPIALLRSGRCRRMILTDISPDALENARENIARARLTDRVEFRLGDGLRTLGEECGMISILGMGGRTIQQILTEGKEHIRGAGLLLSAHTDLPLVRQAVMDVGYRILSETPCFDAGRFYLMVRAIPGKETMSPRELRLGKKLFESDSPDLRNYLIRRKEILETRLAGLRKAGEPNHENISELEEDLRFLERKTREM